MSILRSWPGLIHFVNPKHRKGPTPLQALVDTLKLQKTDVRVSQNGLFNRSCFFLEDLSITFFHFAIIFQNPRKVSFLLLHDFQTMIMGLFFDALCLPRPAADADSHSLALNSVSPSAFRYQNRNFHPLLHQFLSDPKIVFPILQGRVETGRGVCGLRGSRHLARFD